MQRRQLGLAVAIAAAITIAIGARVFAQSAPVDDAILLRVFLSDGRSLVSYGEPARVAGRVVFSMPSSEIGRASCRERVLLWVGRAWRCGEGGGERNGVGWVV